MVREGLRFVLTLICLMSVILFIASLALGYWLYFGVPMNMEPFIVDYSRPGGPVLRAVESPHPYPANWTDRLVLKVPYARLRIDNLTLENGDILLIVDVNTGDMWLWAGNGTGLLTKTFYANSTGFIDLNITIVDDGDGRTSWGLRMRTYATDIWVLGARPYILIVVLPIALPVVPAWALAAFLQALFTALIVASWAWRGGFHNRVLGGWREPFLKNLRNPLYALPFIATATLTGTVLLTLLMEHLGVGAGLTVELPGPLLVLLETTYAAVVEEIGFRFFLIGLPLAIAALAKAGYRPRAEVFLKALLCPGALDRDLRKSLRPLMAFLALASSVAFGLVHVLLGAWELGKAITATVAGLVMAFCFIEYGLHASMLVHWYFNYHLQVWSAAHDLLGPPYDLLDLFVVLYELALGALSLLVFAVQGLRLAIRRTRMRIKSEGI
ncbi:hypothetical protein DRO32_00850 [Candidatus Bathyarchaeota archaeon]|nr:MAG: hypothetical protein DRO32_00850 [Candidatus Bathyarchaeota archaeon]